MATVATGKSAPKIASAKEVRGAVVKMSEAFLQCRDLGHTWLQYRLKRVRAGFERDLYCRSCKAKKAMLISAKGEILATAYSYDQGYQIKGLGRIQAEGKAVLRLESMDRTLSEGEFNLGDPALLDTSVEAIKPQAPAPSPTPSPTQLFPSTVNNSTVFVKDGS